MPDKFEQLCTAFRHISGYMDNKSWKSPSGWPPDGGRMAALIEGSATDLPLEYQQSFFRPLHANMACVALKLNTGYMNRVQAGWPETDARFYTMLRADSLIGAAMAWSIPDSRRAVQRFEAVVLDLFESFIRKSDPVLKALHLENKLPPLVTFAPAPSVGPATLNEEVVEEYSGAEVSIVSLPPAYAADPMLWGILAHETCGHAVTHALHDLAEEFVRTVKTVTFQYGPGLWTHWVEEAAADVYGVLNIGPVFVISLAAWLKESKKSKKLETSVTLVKGKPDDEHPPDLLRLYVLRGAVAALRDLSTKKAWLSDVDAMIRVIVGNADCITVNLGDPLRPQKLPLEPLARDAEQLGKTLATMSLVALTGNAKQSIQDVETWDDTDEKTALAVKAQAKCVNQPLDVKGADVAHLIAGTTMALCENAALYESLNERLGTALQASFDKAELFHRPRAARR